MFLRVYAYNCLIFYHVSINTSIPSSNLFYRRRLLKVGAFTDAKSHTICLSDFIKGSPTTGAIAISYSDEVLLLPARRILVRIAFHKNSSLKSPVFIIVWHSVNNQFAYVAISTFDSNIDNAYIVKPF